MTRAGWLAGAATALAITAAVVVWADSSGGAPVAAAGETSGATLFQAKGCAGCHAGPDSRPEYADYPSLVDVGEWAGHRRAGMDARAYLAESIRTPGVFVSPAYRGTGPSPMPALGLSDREIDALVDYLLQG
jgi:mono/diheme cytochrome c family protein